MTSDIKFVPLFARTSPDTSEEIIGSRLLQPVGSWWVFGEMLLSIELQELHLTGEALAWLPSFWDRIKASLFPLSTQSRQCVVIYIY